MLIAVTAAPGATTGHIRWPGGAARCALGRSGISAAKREGDGATPAGRFALRHLLFRPDRRAAPRTGLVVRPLSPADGWCDEPGHPSYNRPVDLPFPASHERLWLEDAIYDLIVILGHNDAPPAAGAGSAVFLHLARPGLTPTAGCVALLLPDLLALLRDCRPGDALAIAAGG